MPRWNLIDAFPCVCSHGTAKLGKSMDRKETRKTGQRLAEDFRALSDKILRCELHNMQRAAFLREASHILADFSGCDSVEIQLMEARNRFTSEVKRGDMEFFRFETEPLARTEEGVLRPRSTAASAMERLCDRMLNSHTGPTSSTRRRSFWIGDPNCGLEAPDLAAIGGESPLLAIIPLELGADRIGLLHLKSNAAGFFTYKDIQFYEGIGQILGIALAHRRSHGLLRERVKELTCLYGIARVAAQSELSLEEILQRIVELLPPAWLYPEYASARIVVAGNAYVSPDFREGVQKQSAEIIARGQPRGVVEVGYAQKMPERDEGPFLKEERSLIDTIAHEVAIVIERRGAEEEKARLQDQLRHADRLATIGQLAAGVAHELNEPLGSILGFAQLAAKCHGLPDQARKDIDKIAAASLHAREVIRKLMLFARQAPSARSRIDLNSIVEEGITFFESRCSSSGIELQRCLQPDLPEIAADPAQMTQVLVNLVVNAIQAMPRGGKLRIQTLGSADWVSLIVEDTGVGMSREVLSKIFIPFFTTKDVNEGTGLGLPVIHGIITSHGGTVAVDSAEGRGSRFDIRLPIKMEEKEEQVLSQNM